MSDIPFGKINNLGSYKSLVAGLACTAISVTGFVSIHKPNDPLVERVKNIESYYNQFYGYTPGRYGINMNSYIYKNLDALTDSLHVRDQLTSILGYELREKDYSRSDMINRFKEGVSIMSAGAGFILLYSYGFFVAFNSDKKYQKKKGDKNATKRI